MPDPTLLVDFGLLAGADIDPTWFIIGSPTQGIIGTNLLTTVNDLSDFSDRVIEMTVTQQSSRSSGPIVTYSAGTLSLTMTNPDGSLDPYNLAAAGLIAPGSVVRVRKVYNGVTYPVFRGYVDTWTPDHRYPDLAMVLVTATDGMSVLAQQERIDLVIAVGAGEDTGARINRVLDAASWPTADRNIAVGDSPLQATIMTGDPLSEIQAAAFNEIGEFYVDTDGTMFFRNRRAVFGDARSSTSQATFGTNVAGGEIPYVDVPVPVWDRTQLANNVQATVTGGTMQTAVDTASQSRYGTYTVNQELILMTDADAASWASYVLAQSSQPEFRFDSINLNGALTLAFGTPVDPMTQILTRRFGDRITIARRPPGVVDIRDWLIRSRTITWTNASKQLLCTWGLQPAGKYPFFVIGSPTAGIIGVDLLAF